MERSLLKSKIIEEFEAKINQGKDTQAVEELLYELEHNGTPLMEELDGDVENKLVTFIFSAEEEYKNVVFIPPVGRDNLLEHQMERITNTNLWYIAYKVRNDLRFRYYFSPDDSFDEDWEKRLDRCVHDKFNANLTVIKGGNGQKDKLRSFVVMPNADKDYWVNERTEIPKGRVYEHQFKSEHYENQRRVRVYTPYGYSEDEKSYGFIVLTDGDEYINILSATHVLDNLIFCRKIPPIIAIFIDPAETRRNELKCNDTFCNMLVKELIPWVRQNYNISTNPENAVIGGLSLGGLSAAYLGLKFSNVFGNVLSQSGSYWYKPEGYRGDCWIADEFKASHKLPLKFYLNVGILETKDRMIDTNIRLRDILISKGYSVGFEMFKGGHDYLCWGETLANGLISLMGIK